MRPGSAQAARLSRPAICQPRKGVNYRLKARIVAQIGAADSIGRLRVWLGTTCGFLRFSPQNP